MCTAALVWRLPSGARTADRVAGHDGVVALVVAAVLRCSLPPVGLLFFLGIDLGTCATQAVLVGVWTAGRVAAPRRRRGRLHGKLRVRCVVHRICNDAAQSERMLAQDWRRWAHRGGGARGGGRAAEGAGPGQQQRAVSVRVPVRSSVCCVCCVSLCH